MVSRREMPVTRLQFIVVVGLVILANLIGIVTYGLVTEASNAQRAARIEYANTSFCQIAQVFEDVRPLFSAFKQGHVAQKDIDRFVNNIAANDPACLTEPGFVFHFPPYKYPFKPTHVTKGKNKGSKGGSGSSQPIVVVSQRPIVVRTVKPTPKRTNTPKPTPTPTHTNTPKPSPKPKKTCSVQIDGTVCLPPVKIGTGN